MRDLRAANKAALPAKSLPRVVNGPAGVHHGGKEQQAPWDLWVANKATLLLKLATPR